ncbi:MAG: elongation factor G [Pirellulaceae bacterium]|nr:elongation factor G [Pirellulaceae bacterium]
MSTRLQRLRNIGISAHIDSGKTTLTERMLYYCGRIHAMHDVRGADGHGATMDSDPIERKRGITIQSAVTSVDWNGHTFQVIDTPGHVDFTVEVERSLRVLDGAVLVLCSVGGVQSQSLTVDRQMRRYGVPRVAFINKMDRIGANPNRVIDQMRERLNCNVALLQLPIGLEDHFEGIVDLVTMQAVYFDGEFGQRVRRECIPTNMLAEAEAARGELLEVLSLADEELLEVVLAGKPPTVDQVRASIRQSTIAHRVTPVLMGTAFKNKGVQELLDAVAYYLPSPLDRQVWAIDLSKRVEAGAAPAKQLLTSDVNSPLVAMAFKTTVDRFGPLTFVRVYQGRINRGEAYLNTRTGKRHRFPRLVRIHANNHVDIDAADAGDLLGVVGLDCAQGDTFVSAGCNVAMENILVAEPVMRLSIQAQRHEDSDKLAKALERFRRQDPTFHYGVNQESGEMEIAGMGQLHLDVYIERIREEHECAVYVGRPQVAYKERPTRDVEFEYRLKKQTGGPGQFAHIVGRLEVLPEDSEVDFEFQDKVVGGQIDRAFLPTIRESFQDALSCGPLGQFPIVGVRIVLTDGEQHEKDSSEFAFRQCVQEAMRHVILPRAGLELLEPVMQLEVEVPSEYQGGVAGNLARKRGVVKASTVIDGNCRIEAEVPFAELLDYANEIRSLTQGKGTFTMTPNGYRATPKRVQDDVLAHAGMNHQLA